MARNERWYEMNYYDGHNRRPGKRAKKARHRRIRRFVSLQRRSAQLQLTPA